MRFFNLLAAAIASFFSCALTFTLSIAQFLEQLALMPLRLLGIGRGRPAPAFEPEMPQLDLVAELDGHRERLVTVTPQDRDGIASVLGYCKALPPARATTDLSHLRPEVREALLCMNDLELKAMAGGGLGAARRFLSAADHGVCGMPAVQSGTKPSVLMTAHERMKWKVQAQMMKADHSHAVEIKC